MKSIASSVLIALIGALSGTLVAAEEPAGTTAKRGKPDIAKGEAAFTARACAACHNADGNASVPTNPKLAQQHPEYLLKQLEEFKSNKRKNAVMSGMAATLSDEEMRDISWFMAAQKQKPGFAKDKDLVALGERIYRGGLADRNVPACAGCHSPNGAGIPAQYPRLAGQHAEYVATQLTAFRDGVRLNSIPMSGVAKRLNDREIKAVSDYIAGLR
ncbi:c-type cytochrome [Variovorax sp. GT1P44]|uniref:c-type cytochrome n=1 Tax=Variovorax sp. GT1P44 TaxID=3443742 RepID=UPI003F448A3C